MVDKRDLSRLFKHAGEAETLVKLLANRNRLMVLCSLHDGEMSVGELNDCVPLSQSALSQHLAILRSAGIVATRREAQVIYYRLADERATTVIDTLYRLFCATD